MLVTGYQLAAARALIGLKRPALAALANVSKDAIARMEASKEGPIGGGVANLQAVQAALEARGVDFLNHGQPGVRLRSGADGSASIAVEDLTSENDE
jgi:transcriptional regulator with XRE-family HTH domain